MPMLDKVKSLRRKGKVRFEKASSKAGGEASRSKKTTEKRRSMKWPPEDPREAWSCNSRVRFDVPTRATSPTRSSRVTPKSGRDLHRGRRGEETSRHGRGRRSKSVVGRLSHAAWGQQGMRNSSLDMREMARRAKSTGWVEAKAPVKKEWISKDGRPLVYRKESKTDAERVEEMFKLASECSRSSDTVSIQSVWHSLIAIENDVH